MTESPLLADHIFKRITVLNPEKSGPRDPVLGRHTGCLVFLQCIVEAAYAPG